MKSNFCFSVLALKPKYQMLARSLAKDLETHAPGIPLVIGTDNPNFFDDCPNVSAFQFQKRGILHCYNDKRFVIEKALTQFDTVVQIDADTKITHPIPASIQASVGVAAIHIKALIPHAEQYAPERLPYLHKLADKLRLNLSQTSFVGESLFAVSAKGGKAQEFIRQWDVMACYLELHGIHAGEGNAIGMAAAKAGLEITQPPWLDNIDQARQHVNASIDFSHTSPKRIFWNQLGRRLSYHYRLNLSRIIALQDFSFYYR